MGKEKETNDSLYSLLIGVAYLSVIVEFILYVLYLAPELDPVRPVVEVFHRIFIYRDGHIMYSKLFSFFLLIIISIGSKPRKSLKVNVKTKILLPIFFGILFFFGSLYFYFADSDPHYVHVSIFEWIYVILSVVGAIMLNVGFNNISKIIYHGLMDDQFNRENESFMQPTEIIENEYSLNLPMTFYYKNKMRKGWFNLTNPFRGTLILGTPESGKSYSIIIPFIKRAIKNKFTMIIYDYKYPDLGKIAYFHYLQNKRNKETLDYKFHVVNLNDVEYSRRVNPLATRYLPQLANCIETSEALVESLRKGKNDGGGADQFFTQSAINFLSAIIYFLSKYEGGKYSTLPHVLALMNREYQEIFDLLFQEVEIESLMSVFKTAYAAKAWGQLEGQIGTLKVNLSRLHTKESSWVFSGDDVDLRISSKENPSIFVIANTEETRSVNSATNSLLLNRLVKLINTKGNHPCGVVIDELPTIFFHKIQNLISTARSNKVAVVLGVQEIPQIEEAYGKPIASTITSVIGNIVSGAVRKKETTDWLEKLFGKVKQIKKGVSISRETTSLSVNEQMGELIPASNIADLATGEVVAKLAMSQIKDIHVKEPLNTYNCKIEIDVKNVKKEEKMYVELPKYYNFDTFDKKNEILLENFKKINLEIEMIINSIT